MSAKPTPPRSMEETLKTLVANQAAMRRELARAKQDYKARLGKEAAARKKLAAEFDAFKKGVKEYDNLPGIYYEKSSSEILLAPDRSKAVEEALSSGLPLFRAEGANGLRQITTPEDARKPKTTPRARQI